MPPPDHVPFEEAVLSALGEMREKMTALEACLSQHTAREDEMLRMYQAGKIVVKALIWIGGTVGALAASWAWVVHNFDIAIRR